MTPAKRLYLISYFFAPLGRADGVNRAYLTKYLAEAGWDVRVICCRNPHGFLQSFQRDESLLDILPPAVRRHPVACPWWGPLGGIAALLGLSRDAFANWRRPVWRQAPALCAEPGILYAIVPPVTNAIIAARIARERGLPLVLDFRDNVFNLPRDLVASADLLVASTGHSLDEMRHYYNAEQQAGLTMLNGFAVAPDLPPRAPATADRLEIVYAGLLNHDQDPAMLARAAQALVRRRPEMRGRVRINYYGPENYYTRLFLRPHLSDTVRFHGYLPFARALEKIRAADAAYVSLRPCGNAYRIPSKVFQYIAMETPLLAAGPPGALEALVNGHGIGLFSPADDAARQVDNLERLLTQPAERERMVENLRRVKPQFSMSAQARQLGERLECLLGGGVSG